MQQLTSMQRPVRGTYTETTLEWNDQPMCQKAAEHFHSVFINCLIE